MSIPVLLEEVTSLVNVKTLTTTLLLLIAFAAGVHLFVTEVIGTLNLLHIDKDRGDHHSQYVYSHLFAVILKTLGGRRDPARPGGLICMIGGTTRGGVLL
ncbi:unnamed protein product [Amoebophrya sp. A25]|nr:unnamed protein product [Amoebophrya sp. A25]|eukprot:GSA25T00006936001.1